MADAADSKSVGRKAVWVRLPPPAPFFSDDCWNVGKLGVAPVTTACEEVRMLSAGQRLRTTRRKEVLL